MNTLLFNILLLVGCFCAQPCDVQSSKNLIDSGIIAVEINQEVQNPYTDVFPRPIGYTIPPSGARSISSFVFDHGSRPTTGVSYTLRSNINGNNLLFTISINLVIVEWTSIKISYLITSKPDIYVGFWIPDILLSESDSDTIILERSVFVPFFRQQGKTFKPFVFISGIEASKGFSVNIYDVIFQTKTRKIQLKIQKSLKRGSQIFVLTLSYILYPVEDFVFQINFVSPPTQRGSYFLQGVHEANSRRVTVSEVQFGTNSELQCIGDRCSEKCISQSECDEIGIPFNEKCIACLPNSNLVGDKCQCSAGFARSSNGLCEIEQVSCPPNSFYNEQTEQCICIDGYRSFNSQCLKASCGRNQIYLGSTQSCQCIQGYIKNRFDFCIQEQQCSIPGTIYNPNTALCQCQNGLTLRGNSCIRGCGEDQIQSDNSCICRPSFVRLSTGLCGECSSDSFANAQQTACICYDLSSIYNSQLQRCIPCPLNSNPNERRNECICSEGYFKQNNKCQRYQKCPPGSQFDTSSLGDCQCKCRNSDLHLINNRCQSCSQNQQWNGKQCLCLRGFYKIRGKCQRCDKNSVYDGEQCLCKYGYYYDTQRQQCRRCHQSCGQCLGPSRNQCSSCTDVSFQLVLGVCRRSQPCPRGTYRNSTFCERCSPSCTSCTAITRCQTCALGFQIQSQRQGDSIVTFCKEECGDGSRYDHECDDANKQDGDGCSKDCKIEKGWTCMGGTSLGKSTCKRGFPENSDIVLQGTVSQTHEVLQSVRVSFLPQCATRNQCRDCSSILKVRVSQSQFPIQTEVVFIPSSQWQFYVKFNFGFAKANSGFTFVLEFNDQFSQCFGEKNMHQQIKVTVDPTIMRLSEHPKVVISEDL